jgi:hypothetical protein
MFLALLPPLPPPPPPPLLLLLLQVKQLGPYTLTRLLLIFSDSTHPGFMWLSCTLPHIWRLRALLHVVCSAAAAAAAAGEPPGPLHADSAA